MPDITIAITVQDEAVTKAINDLIQRMGNISPVMQAIGDDIVERTKQRFETSIGPDGTPWEPNSPATLDGTARKLGKSYFKKSGSLNKKGKAKLANKRPLIDTGLLHQQIFPTVSGNGLRITASQGYAAIHQFGGQAGRGNKVTIPARPFLPIRQDGSLYPQEQVLILDTLQSFLTQDL